MSLESAAQFAEVLVSPDYRQAVNDAFAEDPELYSGQRDIAENIALGALRRCHTSDYAAWEMRRQATIAELEGTDLGAFNDFFQKAGGLAPAEGKDISELADGAQEVVRTNTRIVGLREVSDDPIDYLDAALNVIELRGRTANRAVGPENYATALKFFADKFLDFPSNYLDREIIKGQVTRCLDGFVAISKIDKPNFVEMTSIFFAIRSLPAGSVEQRFSDTLILQGLKQLPDLGTDARGGSSPLSVMVAGIAKLDLSQTGEAAATLTDLALRKSKKLETSRDYLYTLRTIGNLPASEAANRCFASFLAARNNLEQVLDIEACDVANEQLLKITNDVIDSPQLTQAAKQLAYHNALRATQTYNKQKHLGELTDLRLQQLHQTIINIGSNYSAI